MHRRIIAEQRWCTTQLSVTLQTTSFSKQLNATSKCIMKAMQVSTHSLHLFNSAPFIVQCSKSHGVIATENEKLLIQILAWPFRLEDENTRPTLSVRWLPNSVPTIMHVDLQGFHDL